MPASPERQLTLSAAPAFHLPDLSGLPGGVVVSPEREVRLETTCFDTPDLRLARWGLSLLHRDHQWTLAIPDRSGVPATELRFEGGAERPPDEAVALVRAYARGAALEPVARMSSWSRRVALADASGRRLGEVVDDEISVLDGGRVVARYREVEIDLERGSDALLRPLRDRLRRAGAGKADPMPVCLRALGPAARAEPDVVVPKLPPEPIAGDVVRAALAAGVELVLRYDPLVRIGGDPEHVHQARVGTRRLRSHLRTFRSLLDREWAAGLRDELGWLAGELGAVRDGEVLHDRLLVRIAALPAVDEAPAAALAESLAATVATARARLLEAMSTQRYFDLLERLVAAAAEPRLTEAAASPASTVLLGVVRAPWRDLRRAVRALGEHPADEELHRVRILAKRVRYAAEAAAPALGGDAARFGKLAAAVQTELGEHQDSITMQAWLRGAANGRRRAFVAGELTAMEAVQAQAARDRWPAAWQRLDQRKARAWLTR
ncbi:MAG TPA: CHAD domain-containing protein [Candidatus Dormibacteraeota bacterium]